MLAIGASQTAGIFSMRRRIFWVVIGVPLALIAIGAGAALAVPTTRHMISGLWNLPDRIARPPCQ